MKYKIRQIKPLSKGLYETTTYNGYGEFIGINLIAGIFKAIFKFGVAIFWLPIKYTLGLPFIIIRKIFKH